MKSANHTVKQSTSRIPSATVELELINEVKTFTSGRIGPWTERAIAILRTLESVRGACDGLDGMPEGPGDTVMIGQLTMAINTAKEIAQQQVCMLATFEKADAANGWEPGHTIPATGSNEGAAHGPQNPSGSARTVAKLATPGEADIEVAEAQRVGDGFPTDAHRTLGACLRIMDALVEVRYLADSVNECADEKAWKPIVPKLLEAFRMAWDAARADVEMFNFD